MEPLTEIIACLTAKQRQWAALLPLRKIHVAIDYAALVKLIYGVTRSVAADIFRKPLRPTFSHFVSK